VDTKNISSKRSPLKSLVVFLLGLLGLLYLLNPTAGFLEFIPDNLPFIGNLDEAAAAALLFGALRYFGVDLTAFFSKKKDSTPPL